MSHENLFRGKEKDKATSEKIRLNFAELENEHPEIAYHVKLLRLRTIELENNFFRDSRFALKCFNITATLMLLFPLVAGSLSAFLAFDHSGSTNISWSATIVFSLLTAMVAAGGNAFGWHRRYRAMLAAKWKMTALRTIMDQNLVSLAVEHSGSELSRDELQVYLRMVDKWSERFDGILSTFGDQYGSAIKLPETRMPKNN